MEIRRYTILRLQFDLLRQWGLEYDDWFPSERSDSLDFKKSGPF